VYDVGYVQLLRGEEDDARQIFEEAIQISMENNYSDVAALATRNLGYMMCEEGQWQESEDLLVRSLNLSKQVGKPFWIAMVQKQLARLMYKMGRLAEARDLLQPSLTTIQERGEDFEEVIKIQSDLGLVMHELGEVHEASSLLEMAAEGARSRSLDRAIAYSLSRRAEVEELRGNREQATSLAQEAYEMYDRLGAKYWMREPEAVLKRLETTTMNGTET
jgi:tetratricopeptide (TPR) repeat protein